MQYPKFTEARRRLIPLVTLLLTTALGGCIAYGRYPSSNYSYSYPSGYYAGYPRTYSSSYNYRPYYSPEYGRYNGAYESRGGGDN
jgi:hypothetical protein